MEKVKREVEEVIGLDCSNAVLTSAKQGIGIEDILEAVVKRIPPPPDNTHKPLRALIFDSYYDPYKAWLLSLACPSHPLLTPQLKSALILTYSGSPYAVAAALDLYAFYLVDYVLKVQRGWLHCRALGISKRVVSSCRGSLCTLGWWMES